MMHSRNLLWLLPLLVFISAPLWQGSVSDFLRPRGGYDSSVEAKMKDRGRDFVLDDIVITLSTAGRQDWYVTADRALTGANDQDIHMYGVNARHTGLDGELTTIVSREGSYNTVERHLTLIDQVVVTKPARQEELRTDLLHYHDRNKMVISPMAVELRKPGVSIDAGRMDYDLINGAYDFGKGVICNL